MGQRVYYFQKGGAECQFSKLEYAESSFVKTRKRQYNLPKKKKSIPSLVATLGLFLE
jgi:hypothetical protein